jgi:hypothetical protein
MSAELKIIAMIDQLPTAQPGALSCPGMFSGTPVVTFRFLARSDGPALAAASEFADVSEPTTPCDPLSFSIRGNSQTPLLRGAAFLHRVQRLLGVKLASLP